MQIQKHDQADHYPDVEDEIDAAPDPDQRRKPGRVRRYPDEIERRESREHGQKSDYGGAAVFDPGIEQDAAQQAREDDLRDHRCSLCADKSTRMATESPSFWPLARE